MTTIKLLTYRWFNDYDLSDNVTEVHRKERMYGLRFSLGCPA